MGLLSWLEMKPAAAEARTVPVSVRTVGVSASHRGVQRSETPLLCVGHGGLGARVLRFLAPSYSAAFARSAPSCACGQWRQLPFLCPICPCPSAVFPLLCPIYPHLYPVSSCVSLLCLSARAPPAVPPLAAMLLWLCCSTLLTGLLVCAAFGWSMTVCTLQGAWPDSHIAL